MALASVIQLQSGSDSAKNLEMACEGIQHAAEAGAKLVALPEEFLTLGLTREQKKACAEEYNNGPFQTAIADCAKKNNIWVVAGTLPIKAPNGKIASTCIVFDSAGSVKARYDKIHLFDVTVSETERYCESDAFEAGDKVVVLDTPIGRVGLAICYDVRFPELFRAMAFQGAEVFILPSAFTIPTGTVHWEVLIRARAIENLCYMLAPNESGFRPQNVGTYGHSMIISPWGEVLAHTTHEPQVMLVEIDLKALENMRQEFPVLSHRKQTVMTAIKEL